MPSSSTLPSMVVDLGAYGLRHLLAYLAYTWAAAEAPSTQHGSSSDGGTGPLTKVEILQQALQEEEEQPEQQRYYGPRQVLLLPQLAPAGSISGLQLPWPPQLAPGSSYQGLGDPGCDVTSGFRSCPRLLRDAMVNNEPTLLISAGVSKSALLPRLEQFGVRAPELDSLGSLVHTFNILATHAVPMQGCRASQPCSVAITARAAVLVSPWIACHSSSLSPLCLVTYLSCILTATSLSFLTVSYMQASVAPRWRAGLCHLDLSGQTSVSDLLIGCTLDTCSSLQTLSIADTAAAGLTFMLWPHRPEQDDRTVPQPAAAAPGAATGSACLGGMGQVTAASQASAGQSNPAQAVRRALALQALASGSSSGGASSSGSVPSASSRVSPSISTSVCVLRVLDVSGCAALATGSGATVFKFFQTALGHMPHLEGRCDESVMSHCVMFHGALQVSSGLVIGCFRHTSVVT